MNKIPEYLIPFGNYKFDSSVHDQLQEILKNDHKTGVRWFSRENLAQSYYGELSPKTDLILRDISDRKLGAWLCTYHGNPFWFSHTEYERAKPRLIPHYDSDSPWEIHFVCVIPQEVRDALSATLV